MNNQFGMGNMQIQPTSASSTEERFTASMNNQFNMAGAYAPRPPESPFKKMDDSQLLNELRSLASFSHQTPAAYALLHEIHKRATKSFGVTLTPTKEIQGEGYLYTTIVKNGAVFHFFVDGEENVKKIKEVLTRTVGEEFLFIENIDNAVLGDEIFRIETVNNKGERLEASRHGGLNQIRELQRGFNVNPRHPSFSEPVITMAMPFHAFSHVSNKTAIVNSIQNAMMAHPNGAQGLISLIESGVDTHLIHVKEKRSTSQPYQLVTLIKLFYTSGQFSFTFEEQEFGEPLDGEVIQLLPLVNPFTSQF